MLINVCINIRMLHTCFIGCLWYNHVSVFSCRYEPKYVCFLGSAVNGGQIEWFQHSCRL